MTQNPSSALRKMLGERAEASNDGRPVHRAFRQAIGRTADETLKTHASVEGIEDRLVSLGKIGAALPEGGLTFKVQNPDGGGGILAISAPIVHALVDLQLLGQFAASNAGDLLPTETDAALCTGYLTEFLAGFGATLEGVEGEEWTQNYALTTLIDDLKRLPLELPDTRFRMLQATIAMGAPDEGPQGLVLLILPSKPLRSEATGIGPMASHEIREWSKTLRSTVNRSTVKLDAQLYKTDRPLRWLRKLNVGQLVPLPLLAEQNIQIKGQDGKTVATGRIGMVDGMKAICVTGIGEQKRAKPETETPPAPEIPSPTQSTVHEPDPTNLPDTGFGIEAPVQDLSSGFDPADPLDDLPELQIASGT